MNDAQRKALLEKEYFTLGAAEPFRQVHDGAAVGGSVTRHHIVLRPQDQVPYEGADARTRAAFPQGFPPSYGSGLAFKGMTADGGLAFYAVTDRGPNGDAPKVHSPAGGMADAKFFPAPGFVPAVGVIEVGATGARLVSAMPLMVHPNMAACGLPPAPAAGKEAHEVPLLDTMRFDPTSAATFSTHGIDSEAIAWDSLRQVWWISDEYGPFLLRVDPASGLVLKRYGPGSGLPPILARRRLNRGMEGMTYDADGDRVHAFLQSPLSDGWAEYAPTGKREKVERYAAFARWIEFDPDTAGTTRMLAYPLDPGQYHDGRTGNAKLGDLVALGHGKFVVIEQGKGRDGQPFNHLVLVDANGASNIGAPAFNPDSSDLEQSSMKGTPVRGADWATVTPLKKRLLLDLNAIGWVADKAEGLALADPCTLAVSSDNDFGLKTQMASRDGTPVSDVDITELEADADGSLPDYDAWVGLAEEQDRASRLWILRFDCPLSGY